MQVKMGENSSGIDDNLNTVRVETARYGFLYTDLKVGHRNMKRASTDRKESLRFETGQHGLTQFHKLCFMFAAAGRQGSVRVNQELDAGPQVII
jgi:hypothetical protein